MNLVNLIGVILLIEASAHALKSDVDEWESFKLKYNKTYETFDESVDRFKIFKKNLDKFREHNFKFERGDVTFRMGVNRDADLTYDEIVARENPPINESIFTSLKRLFIFKTISSQIITPNVTLQVPDSLDWRSRGAMNPIQDQSQTCGSCWAFAVIASVESYHFIKTGKLFKLSEQQLVDCSTGNMGCNGGYTNTAFSYIAQNDLSLNKDYPYKAKDGECRLEDVVEKSEVKVYGYAEMPGDEEIMKFAINEFGPIVIFINAKMETFHFYTGGVYYDPECDGVTNHAVVIIGYGHDKNLDMDYWIVRNSWSQNWGESGYFRIARNKNGACGITTAALIPLLTDNGENQSTYVMFIAIGIIVVAILLLVFCCCCCYKLFRRCRRHRSNGFDLY